MIYFPEPYTPGKSKIKVELSLSNHATKVNFKNITGVDKSKFVKQTD